MVTLDQANAGRAKQGLAPWTQEKLDSELRRQALARQGKPADSPDQPPPPANTTRPKRRGPGQSLRGPVDAVKTTGKATSGILRGKTPATLSAAALGILGYALLDNFVAGGWPQVKGWFGAKFLNKPYTGASSTTTSPDLTTPATTITGVPGGLIPAPIVPTASTTGSVVAPSTTGALI